MLAGRAVQEPVQLRENPLRREAVPAGRQELLGQARVQVRQPAPLGQELDIIRESGTVSLRAGRRRRR